MAAGCRESGLWLNAIPSPALGTLLDSETFHISVALKVGAEVCQPHPCRCGKKMDALGMHGSVSTMQGATQGMHLYNIYIIDSKVFHNGGLFTQLSQCYWIGTYYKHIASHKCHHKFHISKVILSSN